MNTCKLIHRRCRYCALVFVLVTAITPDGLLSPRCVKAAVDVERISRSANTSSSLICLVTLNDIEYQSNIMERVTRERDEFYACNPVRQEDGQVSSLIYAFQENNNLPSHILEEFQKRSLVETEINTEKEDFFVLIPNGRLTIDSVTIPNANKIEILEPPEHWSGQRNSQGRLLSTFKTQKSMGNATVLTLRVVAVDSEPMHSSEELYNLSFNDTVSLKRQFQHCSFGKLNLEPTEYGVLHVDVNLTAEGNTQGALLNAAYTRAAELVDRDVRELADILIVVLPPGTGNWAAFATVSGKQSIFNDRWAGYLGTNMHELGHNLGLFHSMEKGKEYGGTTGYMGRNPQKNDFPLKCFNSQNHWFLGWYADRAKEVVDPTIPVTLTVRPFVDYNRTAKGEYVLVKINDLYLQYNRAKSFNRETSDMKNALTIVRSITKATDLVAGLDLSNPVYNETIYHEKQNRTLTIRVCEVVTTDVEDFMVIKVGYGEVSCFEKNPTIRQEPPSVAPIIKLKSSEPMDQPTGTAKSRAPAILISSTAHPSISPLDDKPPTVAIRHSFKTTISSKYSFPSSIREIPSLTVAKPHSDPTTIPTEEPTPLLVPTTAALPKSETNLTNNINMKLQRPFLSSFGTHQTFSSTFVNDLIDPTIPIDSSTEGPSVMQSMVSNTDQKFGSTNNVFFLAGLWSCTVVFLVIASIIFFHLYKQLRLFGSYSRAPRTTISKEGRSSNNSFHRYYDCPSASSQSSGELPAWTNVV